MEKQSKIRICLFVHFSISDTLPYYVQVFANELSNYFDEVRFLCNNKNIEDKFESLNKNVLFYHDKNQGYDFGRIYNYLHKLNLDDYAQIACVNDSNILLGKLNKIMDWGRSSHFDLWGTIDSNEKPWFSIHTNHFHIQSHFIVFNQKAIKYLPAFFESVDMEVIFNEKDTARLRRAVINDWEIGLTQFFIKQGLSCGSYITSNKYVQKYHLKKSVNVSHKFYYKLIKDGYPFIKRKVITDIKWRDRIRIANHWKRVIKKYRNNNWATNTLISELHQSKN